MTERNCILLHVRWSLCLVFAFTPACKSGRPVQEKVPKQQAPNAAGLEKALSQEEAIALAFENYKRVFENLFVKSFEPGVWVRLPMPSSDKLFCTDQGSYWDIKHDGNVGMVFHAHVDKGSGRVEWQWVSMAFE